MGGCPRSIKRYRELTFDDNDHDNDDDDDDMEKKALKQGPCYQRSEEHTSELQSPVPISYAVFCLKKQNPFSHNLLNAVFLVAIR